MSATPTPTPAAARVYETTAATPKTRADWDASLPSCTHAVGPQSREREAAFDSETPARTVPTTNPAAPTPNPAYAKGPRWLPPASGVGDGAHAFGSSSAAGAGAAAVIASFVLRDSP